MQTTELQREFKYNSVKLADPNPAFTLVQVRDFFANVYPEIISADIEGPDVIGNKQIYSFRRAVGTKGIATDGNAIGAAHSAQFACNASPSAAPARRPVAAMVRDLAELGRIDWFHSEARTAAFIRITAEFVADNPQFLLSDRHQSRISALHAAHCSRTRSAAV